MGMIDRRAMIQVGGLAFAGSVLPGFAEETTSPDQYIEPKGPAKQVLFLWMGGGVTHIDSFDPKPLAPETIRGTLGAISTALPGIQFGETMPHLARIADDLCVVRSFSHDSNDHLLSQVYTLSGRKVNRSELFKHPNIGSIFSYLYGPSNGLPGYIAVPGITWPGPPPHNLFVGGWLGDKYAPFAVGNPPEFANFVSGPNPEHPDPFKAEDLRPKSLRLPEGLSPPRLDSRTKLLANLDLATQTAEHAKPVAGMEGHYESAMNLLTSPQIRGAFDIAQEPATVRDEYGRTKIGGRCLLARRLIEAGSRFTMVDYGYDPDYGNLWDNHNAASQKFPHISKMCQRPYHLAGMDQAFAALITDLKTRGLLDSTLVVFLTEFGRTPKINPRGGRDHWGACGSIFFTGGGTQVGQVIGSTDKEAGYPITMGFTPADITATIYRAVGLELEHRVYDLQGRPWPILGEGAPIEGVLA